MLGWIVHVLGWIAIIALFIAYPLPTAVLAGCCLIAGVLIDNRR